MFAWRRVVILILVAAWPGGAGNAWSARPFGTAPSLASYSLTAVVTYDQLPDGNLPASFRTTIGRHEVVEHYLVRDATHYRVDLDFILPALDAGTLTFVVNGRHIEGYDSRTEMAAWDVLSPSVVPAPTDVYVPAQPQLQQPNPRRPLRQYLTHLTWTAWSGPGHVRIVRRTRLLGRPVAVIDLTSPSTNEGGGVRGQGGHARLWVTLDHPVLLRYEEYRMIPSFSIARRHYVYRATDFRFGPVSGPALHYVPPVKPMQTDWIDNAVTVGDNGDSMVSSGSNLTLPAVGPLLFRPPQPKDDRGRPYVLRVADLVRDSVRPELTGLDAFFCRGQCLGGGSAARGRTSSVYVQERLQMHGLPPALQQGQPLRQGACRVWTGAYGAGEPWAALARGPISLVVTTNTLSRADLERYAFTSLCR